MILNIRALAVLAVLSLSAAACAVPTEEDTQATAEETSDLVSRSAYFESFKGIDGQYYFHLMAGNGENVLRSEGYTKSSSAQNGITSVLANGGDKRNFDVQQAMSGEWYFNLVAGNGEVVGTSQLYSTKSNADRGARTVRALIRLFHGATAAEAQQAPHNERFELFKGEDKQTYFRLRAGNGEIMLASEGYKSTSGAQNGVASVKANGQSSAQFQVFEAFDGGWAIRLVAGNGEIIARGESYASKSNANRAVARLVEILANDVTVASVQ
jgi:uncharacterized protein YegP (UPF0339 family)